MSAAAIVSMEGRRLEIGSPRRDVDLREPWSFDARLVLDSAEAAAAVWEYGLGIGHFLSSLAEAWQGWDGTRSYSSLEGQLTIDAVHDGKGLVICQVSLGSPIPPDWSLSAEMTFGAGAHMESVASDVDRAFS